MISLFELFKIGIGPSSSHTVGPMRAAYDFSILLRDYPDVIRVEVTLLGSLAWTGVGHATDKAVVLGLMGYLPDTINPDLADELVAGTKACKEIFVGERAIRFDPATDIIFDRETVPPVHPNTLQFTAYDREDRQVLCRRICSIGGGFIIDEAHAHDAQEIKHDVPFDIPSGQALLDITRRTGLTIAQIVFANECALRPAHEVTAGMDKIIATMMGCIDRGMHQEGVLPGRLAVRRRAAALYERLKGDRFRNVRSAHEVMDWVSLYAIAVNEENAAGGRIVTAPTNGAAGVVPAVLRYYRDFCPGATLEREYDFLLTATAIGGLFKRNASISGAEVGCQGEVGVACSMAAAGLAAALGADPLQIENAAEIGMEHHLGMTCDPVGGLVQIPCIERNAFGAVKAINAASLSMRGDGSHFVSLDKVIVTMRETGADMSSRYKETSLGGLAVGFPEC
ncbi:L-serine ammonia-lyase [Komagataeibacter sp. FNDCF1]|uniref:L-serine ammonia-lyase n=1 Tax=Komagataeibacter sp. FNDCF1 TaxID=2878681 RepID=UPI001E35B06C|nr:L-serine ammonia-lyase [Komagataeibacter sp. FNDCF1]MCE2564549.1 L-serine ammonia-lyase [Komagataeibacter sp. FNDCF1]